MIKPVSRIEGRAYRLGRDNVDTDLIIPAEQLKTVSRRGLGKFLFASLRCQPDNLFDNPSLSSAPILIAGENFGCGSSREHAVWALLDFGIQAVIASSFSDIFAGNAFKNGLLAARVSKADVAKILGASNASPICIDLESCSIDAGVIKARFTIESFHRECLLNGLDEIGLTLAHEEDIRRHEAAREVSIRQFEP